MLVPVLPAALALGACGGTTGTAASEASSGAAQVQPTAEGQSGWRDRARRRGRGQLEVMRRPFGWGPSARSPRLVRRVGPVQAAPPGSGRTRRPERRPHPERGLAQPVRAAAQAAGLRSPTSDSPTPPMRRWVRRAWRASSTYSCRARNPRTAVAL